MFYYSEKVIYLPHSYQINDDRRQIADEIVTRRGVGLPEDGFVFCCFNLDYKISLSEFSIWMRLLRNVPGSVLWLLQTKNSAAQRNLAREAARHSVDPDRIIFAEHKPMPAHLARHRMADLFLDTFYYNAHTGASDALWSGLPLITKIGNSFASRVAASLLCACGLPELITATSGAYERMALDLARSPERLRELKRKLADMRATAALFDSANSTKDIEHGFWAAYRGYVEGSPPRDIDVLAEGARCIE